MKLGILVIGLILSGILLLTLASIGYYGVEWQRTGTYCKDGKVYEVEHYGVHNLLKGQSCK